MGTNTIVISTPDQAPIKYLYGNFTQLQMSEQRRLLQNAVFWCLLYKDPKNAEKYEHVDVHSYFKALMLRVGGLSSLLNDPPALVTLQSLLQAACEELTKSEFDWPIYRKLILDAERLVGLLFVEVDKS